MPVWTKPVLVRAWADMDLGREILFLHDVGFSLKLSSLIVAIYCSFYRFGWRGQSRDSIGTVLCVDDDGILRVGFPGASRGWRADPAEMERVEEFKVGDWVRVRPSLTASIHGMEAVTPGSIGIVYSIRPDSSLLLGLCYLATPWHCEPEEVEPVEPFRVSEIHGC